MRRGNVRFELIAFAVLVAIGGLWIASRDTSGPAPPGPPEVGESAKAERRHVAELRADVDAVPPDAWIDETLGTRVSDAYRTPPEDLHAQAELLPLAIALTDRLFRVWLADVAVTDVLTYGSDSEKPEPLTSPGAVFAAAERLWRAAEELPGRRPDDVAAMHARRQAAELMKGRGDLEAATAELDLSSVHGNPLGTGLALKRGRGILKTLKSPDPETRRTGMRAVSAIGCPACARDTEGGAGDDAAKGGLDCFDLRGAPGFNEGGRLCPWPDGLPKPPPALETGAMSTEIAAALGLARLERLWTVGVGEGASAQHVAEARAAAEHVGVRFHPALRPAGPPPADEPAHRPMAVLAPAGSGVPITGLVRGVLHVGPEGVVLRESAWLAFDEQRKLAWKRGAKHALSGTDGAALAAALAPHFAREGTRGGRSALAIDAEAPAPLVTAAVEALRPQPRRAWPTLHALPGDELRVAPIWLLDLGAIPGGWPAARATVTTQSDKVELTMKEPPTSDDGLPQPPPTGVEVQGARGSIQVVISRTTNEGEALVRRAFEWLEGRYGPIAAVELDASAPVGQWQPVMAALASSGPELAKANPYGLTAHCGEAPCRTRGVYLRGLAPTR